MPQIQTPQGPIDLPHGDEQGGPGIPPGLQEILAGLGGGGPEMAPPGSPAPPEAAPAEGQDGPSILKGLLSSLDAYKAVERDEEDLLLAEKIGTLIQQLLAKQQKESDGMMSGKVSPGALRRLGG